MSTISAPLLTTVVGSHPQPDWLIDRELLGSRLPPRIRAQEIWRVAEQYLEQAQNDFYPDDDCAAMDFAAAVNAELRALKQAGADMVQIDVPSGASAEGEPVRTASHQRCPGWCPGTNSAAHLFRQCAPRPRPPRQQSGVAGATVVRREVALIR